MKNLVISFLMSMLLFSSCSEELCTAESFVGLVEGEWDGLCTDFEQPTEFRLSDSDLTGDSDIEMIVNQQAVYSISFSGDNSAGCLFRVQLPGVSGTVGQGNLDGDQFTWSFIDNAGSSLCSFRGTLQ